MEHEDDGDVIGILGTSKGTERLENLRTSGDHRNYGIVEMIGQNSEETPGDLRDLISLRLSWKTIR